MRALLFVPGLLGTALIVGGFISETVGRVGAGFGVAGVWTSGTAATARVVAISEAPGSGEDTPDVDLQLDVAGEQVRMRSVISRLAIPRIQPGCEIQVRRDAADGKKIVIDPGLTRTGSTSVKKDGCA